MKCIGYGSKDCENYPTNGNYCISCYIKELERLVDIQNCLLLELRDLTDIYDCYKERITTINEFKERVIK